MTPISKYRLFFQSNGVLAEKNQAFGNNTTFSMISKGDNGFMMDYSVYSRKRFKNWLKFSTENRFEVKNKENEGFLKENNGNIESSLADIRRKEVFIKYLKGFTSKITRIYMKFEEKALEECFKKGDALEIRSLSEGKEILEEKSFVKAIFLLETQENMGLEENIDWGLMENDRKIIEWEGFLTILCIFIYFYDYNRENQ